MIKKNGKVVVLCTSHLINFNYSHTNNLESDS